MEDQRSEWNTKPTLCIGCYGQRQQDNEHLQDAVFIQPKSETDFTPDYIRGWLCLDCRVVYWAHSVQEGTP